MAQTLETYRRPALSDIARKAGVAVSTASAILAKKDYCYASKTTRNRVFEAANQLGYVANALAKGLQKGKTYTLGLLTYSLNNAPVVMEKADCIQKEARKNGYHVIISTHRDDPKQEEAALRELVGYCVDGIIISPARDSDGSLVRDLMTQGVPIVVIDSHYSFPVWNIVTDVAYGAGLQVDYLLQTGRSNPLFVLSDSPGHSILARIRGFRQTCQKNGMDFDQRWVVRRRCTQGMDAIAWGEEITREIIKKNLPFDSFVVQSDRTASGVLRALRTEGIKVPEDVAVIGFDDDEYARATSPRLTTIHQPRQAGIKAVELLLGQMGRNHAREQVRQITLTPKLVVRESA